ncbi:2OG-Fe(II) oxygenase [Alteromonas mediterranea]|uniref:2OG-Fe(II) oxygenase n=1 Tax=Alteromonas mediterranea TaxID=314275 RepID=UPI002FE04925|tara:strand:- start:1340 stop:2146 length:807 start_codon:yes stop_codon:yes gene_type:complete
MNNVWKRWVLDNILKGVAGGEIYQTLIKNGFVHDEIVSVLGRNLSPNEIEHFTNTHKVIVPQPAFLKNGHSKFEIIGDEKFCVYRIAQCFDEALCDEVIQSIRSGLRPSTITTVNANTYQDFRTSSTCDFVSVNAALNARLNKKLEVLMGDKHHTPEPIQAQHYDVGQEFKAHTDYFEPGSVEYEQHAKSRGQRSWTCMVYLNSADKGGETEFLHLGRRFAPRRGDAIIWRNIDINGVVNPLSLHQAHPVERGEKFIITQWYRLPPVK